MGHRYGTSPLHLHHFWLSPVDQSGGPSVGVLEQGASLLQTFSIAACLGSQVMLGKSLSHVSLGQHAIDEPAPHGIESIARAGLLVEVTFTTLVAE